MKTLINLILAGTLVLMSTIASAQVNLPVDQFVKKYQSTNNAQLLDVRTAGEWEKGKVAAATCVDFMNKDFKQNVSKLDKSKPVFVYCAAGGRSAKAAKILHEAGFTKVYNLTGGGFAQLRDSGLK